MALESRLSHLNQVAETSDIIQDLTSETCGERNKTPCLPEPTELMANQLAYFQKLQLNMTLEMTKAQEETESVSKNSSDLKDRTLAQIHQSIKSYACCIKGMNLDVTATDEDCSSAPAASEQTSDSTKIAHMIRQPPTMRGDFRCSNIKWIPDSYVCDGEDDCGDDFDESDC